VRLSKVCNNHCRFCHDRSSLDGSLRPYDDVLRELREGRAAGAERAVLSGGEPTLHPRLPDAIRDAHRLGYRWAQIVTNGRRLAYPSFLQSLLDAGLDEVTFSLHGSTAAVHDDLVGVPGAFDQTLRGLRAALATRSLIVSIDVVLNRRNLADTPQLVRRAVAEGVREFDLLWLIPFGAAGEMLDHPDRMFLEPDDAPAVRRTIDAARTFFER
jgi:MoaA/NifB/PqqE/SkfB family radical SAM enzyme